jgi:hypothetical protein
MKKQTVPQKDENNVKQIQIQNLSENCFAQKHT